MADAFIPIADNNGNVVLLAGDLTAGVFTVKTVPGGGGGASAGQVQGAGAAGAAPVGNPVLVAGSDGAAARTLLTTSTGALANQEDGVADDVVTTGTLSATGDLVVVDTTGYQSVAFQFTAVGTGNTVAFEGTNDGVNYTPLVGCRIDSTTPIPTSSIVSPTTGQAFVMPAFFKTVRLRVSVFGTGPITAVLVRRKINMGFSSVNLRDGARTIGAITGAEASDAVAASNPVRIGARAQTAAITAVANGDVVDSIATRIGYLIVRPNSIPELEWQVSLSLTGTTAQPLKALTASQKQYCMAVQLQGLTATVTGTLTILSNATPIWTGVIPAGVSLIQLNFPVPLQTAAGEALNIQLGTIPVGAVAVNAQGYTAP